MKCSQESSLGGWSYSRWEKRANISKRFDSYKIYIIECYDENERFIKIGKTFNSVENRFSSKTILPYSFKILEIKNFKNSKECSVFEHQLHTKFKQFKYKPLKNFRGFNECYSYDMVLTANGRSLIDDTVLSISNVEIKEI